MYSRNGMAGRNGSVGRNGWRYFLIFLSTSKMLVTYCAYN